MSLHFLSTPLLLTVFFYLIYKFGETKLESNFFYDSNNKGTLKGKSVFTMFFMIASFFPLFYLNLDLWYKSIFIAFALVSSFELFKSSVKDKKITLMYIITLGIIILSLSILPFYISIIEMFHIILIAIMTDLFSNFFGKLLSKLPERFQFLRLRYSPRVSKNKSFTAVLMTWVLVSVVFYILELDVLTATFVVFGTAFGDAYFSVYKRLQGIVDYFATLGSIGGLLDRIDGWIFAIIFYEVLILILYLFGWFYLNILKKSVYALFLFKNNNCIIFF